MGYASTRGLCFFILIVGNAPKLFSYFCIQKVSDDTISDICIITTATDKPQAIDSLI